MDRVIVGDFYPSFIDLIRDYSDKLFFGDPYPIPSLISVGLWIDNGPFTLTFGMQGRFTRFFLPKKKAAYAVVEYEGEDPDNMGAHKIAAVVQSLCAVNKGGKDRYGGACEVVDEQDVGLFLKEMPSPLDLAYLIKGLRAANCKARYLEMIDDHTDKSISSDCDAFTCWRESLKSPL